MLWTLFKIAVAVVVAWAIIKVWTRRNTPRSAINSPKSQPPMVSVLLKMMLRLSSSQPSHITFKRILTTVSARYASDI